MPVRLSRSIPKPTPPEPAGAWPVILLTSVTAGVLLVSIMTQVFGWDASPLTWYLARASGISLYLLLWASTCLGLGLTTRLLDRFVARGVVYSLHAYLTALSFAFLAMHMAALALDSYTRFTLADILAPFHTGMREPWTGLGVIAAWLLVLVSVSFPLRAITGFRFWRKAHWLTLPLMLSGTAHGIGAGTDSASIPMMVLYAVTTGVTLFLISYRAMSNRQRRLLAPLQTGLIDRMTERSPRNAAALRNVLRSER